MTTIGILGTGNVGRSLAGGWAAAGHDVVLGSRNPQQRTGLPAEVTSLQGAAEHGDVVVNALPGTVTLETLRGVGPGVLDSRLLLDVGIGFTDDGAVTPADGSLGAEIQRDFPSARVVKALCTMTAALMSSPETLPEQTSVFLSGDAPDAKALVSGLLSDLGWPSNAQLDLGGIATAHAQEHYAVFFLALAAARPVQGDSVIRDHRFNIRLVADWSDAGG